VSQAKSQGTTTSIISHEKHIVNAVGCSDSLRVFNTDSVYAYVKQTESATDAARSASSGCANVTTVSKNATVHSSPTKTLEQNSDSFS
jgi:hypothetical protein